MQLASDSGDIDKAIAELQKALPITALRYIISERERKHRPRKELRKYLSRAVAKELQRELV